MADDANLSATPDYGPYMDDGMTEWCDRLNAIPGVVTLQSCTGHKTGDRGGTGQVHGYEMPGSLWFRVERFSNAEWLAAQPTIDQVAHLFGRDRLPLWEVLFLGRNRSEQHLQESMRVIEEALRRV